MMTHPAPIVAGIDFSASSRSVLRHALHAAKINHMPVIALHVLDATQIALLGEDSPAATTAASLTEKAKAKLAQWVAAEDATDKVELEVRHGRPVEELHNAVKDHGASLLVIAANDTTKKRLGTVASRCVRSAPCDVMVLRNWQKGNFCKIVLCCDFSTTSSLALGKAVVIAAENGAELEIVHVMYPPDRDLWGEVLEDVRGPGRYADKCREQIHEEMARFIAPHQAALSNVRHKTVILESMMASVTLTHHIQDIGADLVVLGTRGHSRFMSHFLGTNAERLMQDSPVSVLAVRSPNA